VQALIDGTSEALVALKEARARWRDLEAKVDESMVALNSV
jgi:hypothetical protein